MFFVAVDYGRITVSFGGLRNYNWHDANILSKNFPTQTPWASMFS